MSKVTLFLMSQKGFEVLQSIVSNIDVKIISFIVVGRDKNVVNDFSEDIITLASSNNIKIVERSSKYTVQSQYAIAVSWRWLLGFDDSATQLITLHDSLLPKYRGFAPLVSQLLQKELTIGVTAIFSNNEFDTGDIIDKQAVSISYPIKIQEAISIVAGAYRDIVIRILLQIVYGKEINASPQNEKDASYSLWRDSEDYKIQWIQSSCDIKRFIDAVGYPYLGAESSLLRRKIRILDSEIEEDVVIVNRDIGKIIFIKDDRPIVVCGKGLLKITEAVFDDNRETIFPLRKFRLRFL